MAEASRTQYYTLIAKFSRNGHLSFSLIVQLNKFLWSDQPVSLPQVLSFGETSLDCVTPSRWGKWGGENIIFIMYSIWYLWTKFFCPCSVKRMTLTLTCVSLERERQERKERDKWCYKKIWNVLCVHLWLHSRDSSPNHEIELYLIPFWGNSGSFWIIISYSVEFDQWYKGIPFLFLWLS